MAAGIEWVCWVWGVELDLTQPWVQILTFLLTHYTHLVIYSWSLTLLICKVGAKRFTLQDYVRIKWEYDCEALRTMSVYQPGFSGETEPTEWV